MKGELGAQLRVALDAARAQEREEIVAWLRAEGADLAPHNEQHRVALDHAADAIASLQHKEAGDAH